MPDLRPVALHFHLPEDLADAVEAVQKADPEFLERLLRYGMTRRSIYRHLSEEEEFFLAPAEAPSTSSAPPRPI